MFYELISRTSNLNLLRMSNLKKNDIVILMCRERTPRTLTNFNVNKLYVATAWVQFQGDWKLLNFTKMQTTFCIGGKLRKISVNWLYSEHNTNKLGEKSTPFLPPMSIAAALNNYSPELDLQFIIAICKNIFHTEHWKHK